MTTGIYEAVWHADWKVELKLDDALFNSAREGSVQAIAKIVHRFKYKCRKVHNRKLEAFIDWKDPHFDIKRVRDATESPVAAAPTLATLDQQECPCPDSCVLCDRNDHGWCTDCPRHF